MKKTISAEDTAAVKKTANKENVAKKTAVKKADAPVKKAVAKKATVSKAVKAEPEKKAVKERAHKKLKLSKTMQKHYVSLLIDLRKDYLAQFAYHKQEALTSKKDAAGERAGMATHMADLGSDNFRHDIELGLLSDEGDVLVMIDEALQRIQDSEYGICVECGCEINPERLEAKPYARFCTKCKERHEELEDPSRRHR